MINITNVPQGLIIMENAALLRAIIENAIDGIITIDERGRIETINPAACKLFQRLSVARDSYHTVRLSSLTTPWQDWARRDRVRSRLAAASPALADASVSATILDLIFAVRVSPAMLCAILRGGASRDRRRGVACVPVAVQQG